MQDMPDKTWSFVTADDLVHPEVQATLHSCHHRNAAAAKQQTPNAQPDAERSTLHGSVATEGMLKDWEMI